MATKVTLIWKVWTESSRRCDQPTSQSESIGANMKSTIHRRVSRNKIDGKERKHVRRDASGAIKKRWTQKALLVSRVMQAFRADGVRARAHPARP